MAQLSFHDADGLPEGLAYRPGFLSEAEEAWLAGHIAAIECVIPAKAGTSSR